MEARAADQRENTIEPPARRGDIYDRNGNLLAYTVDADSIIADPTEIEKPDLVASSVCAALDQLRRRRAGGDCAHAAPQGPFRLGRAQGVA